jgi:predicted nucleic acid-binding protein
MLILVSDANILIDMHDGGLIDLIFKLPYRFAIPDIIYIEELEERHPYLVKMGLEIHSMNEVLIQQVETLSIKYLKPSRNDIFALVLAQHQICPLLTGDKELRRAAINERIEVHGTIWLINELFSAELVSVNTANLAFQTMKQRGSRLPWNEIEIMINEWMVEPIEI